MVKRREIIDYYAVLGVARTATLEEIKKAFRTAVKETHTDRTMNLSIEEQQAGRRRYDQVVEAYRFLENEADRAWLDMCLGPAKAEWPEPKPEPKPVPRPEIVVINGITCRVVYYRWLLGTLKAIVEIPETGLGRISTLPDFPRGTGLNYIRVVDAQGTIILSADTLEDARVRLADYQRRQERLAWAVQYQTRLDEFRRQYFARSDEGYDTRHLHGLFAKPQRIIDQLKAGFSFAAHETIISQCFREIERELLKFNRPTLDVWLEALLAGRTVHRDHRANLAMLAKLDAYAVRSDGFIEPLTEEQLLAEYRQILSAADAITVNQIQATRLRLRLEDYAPADILNDPELNLAPEFIELAGRKGKLLYPVTYGFRNMDDERIAVGVVRLPLSVFERNAVVEYGKKVILPELPYGIVLVFEVETDGKVIASGSADSQLLQKQVTRFQRGKRRAGNAEDTWWYGPA